MYDSFNIPVEGKITLSVKTQTDGVKLSSVLRHSESRIVRKLCHRDAAKSLARPGRKQTNVSFGMAWISFGAFPCRKKKSWWQLASRCYRNRARPWHAFELLSFLVGLRTYQHPVNMNFRVCGLTWRSNVSVYLSMAFCVTGLFKCIEFWGELENIKIYQFSLLSRHSIKCYLTSKPLNLPPTFISSSWQSCGSMFIASVTSEVKLPSRMTYKQAAILCSP